MHPRGSESIEIQRILTHYVFFATSLLSVIGWFTAFIGQALATAIHERPFVGSLWFAIWLQLFLIIGVIYTLASDSIAMHRMQISVFGAVALVFAVDGVNTGIFASESRLIAMGAGWFILTIVDIIWLLYFTSEEDSRIFYIFNLFGTGGLTPPSRRRRNTRIQSGHMATNNGYPTSYASGGVQPEGDYGGLKLEAAPPQRSQHSLAQGSPGPDANRSIGSGNMSGSGKLNSPDTAPPGIGMEPNSPLMGGAAGLGAGGGSGIGAGSGGAASPVAGASVGGGRSTTGAESTMAPDLYVYKAKALYTYNASPDDPTEISFAKGDILDITDKAGKWWNARKADGTMGIAPSNYLQLI